MVIDYISMWNEQHAAAARKKKIFTGGKPFWDDPVNARHFLNRLFHSWCSFQD